jgi:hypothetical protein
MFVETSRYTSRVSLLIIASLTDSHSQYTFRYVEGLKDRVQKLEGILSEVSCRSSICFPGRDTPDVPTTTASCSRMRMFGLQISLLKACDEASYPQKLH